MTSSSIEIEEGTTPLQAKRGENRNSKSARPPRPKSEELRRMLARKNGATVGQLQKELGWQPHAIRAAISRLRAGGAEVRLDHDRKVPAYRLVTGA